MNYYNLLGVNSNASLDEIKRAFFDKSKKLHPDSDPSNPKLHGHFVELNKAYQVLSKEQSRKEYDLRIRHTNPGEFTPNSNHNIYRHSSNMANQNNSHYWEQFRHSGTVSPQEMKRKNLRLVGYCLLAMLLSIGVHMALFRKLEEMHRTYMDEKDRVITQLYNESKERARVNGYKKQIEILQQKHEEFQAKYNNLNKGDAK
ncbi:dnaJ homolog subfamily C member 4 isoform X2 [Cynoglossus semilaevis]|nr:dnaJ homolog subfamily C member 4 isoform X2 [Cynoglossus semilaevis]